MKAVYDRFKKLFRLDNEVRDLKFIDYVVSASPADRKAVEQQVQGIYAKLSAGEDPAAVINASKSQTRFIDLPLAAEAFPTDVRQELESMSAGSMKAPYVNDQDNTYNVVKLIPKCRPPTLWPIVLSVYKLPKQGRADSIPAGAQRRCQV